MRTCSGGTGLAITAGAEDCMEDVALAARDAAAAFLLSIRAWMAETCGVEEVDEIEAMEDAGFGAVLASPAAVEQDVTIKALTIRLPMIRFFVCMHQS